MGLSIIISGLPISAKEYIVQAARTIFGNDGAELVEPDAMSLRSRVRLAAGNPSDVMVILDSIAHDKCKDIENGLYSSDKYHEYSDDKDLVAYLNSEFEAGIEYKDEEPLEGSQTSVNDNEELIARMTAQLRDQDALIRSLGAKLKAYEEAEDDEGVSTGGMDGGISSEEFERVKAENLSLKSAVLDEKARVSELEGKLGTISKSIEALEKDAEALKSRNNQLLQSYNSVLAELSDYKVKYSEQSGLVNAKDAEIDSIRSKLISASALSQKVKDLEAENELIVKRRDEIQTENSQLKVDLASKDAEIARINELLENGGVTEKERRGVEQSLSDSQKKIADLEKKIISQNGVLEGKDRDLQSKDDKIIELNSKVESLEGTIGSLSEQVKSSDESMVALNTELIKARSRVDMLEKSTSRDTDVEDMYRRISSLQTELDSVKSTALGKMTSYMSPKSSITVNLLRDIRNTGYKNIRFAFSGSTESRKGTYRALLDEFRSLPLDEKVVIVDVVSETCIDYVFEIKKMVSGTNWFVKGGGIQPYLCQTCLPNVQVMRPGLGYVNEAYFLAVDWDARLRELDNSGYNVVVYCGDLSGIVGRVMHESFAGYGTSIVYIHGNVIGARSIVANLRGISNSKESIICYFEYNPKVKKFYDMVAETNECRVISTLW